MELTAEAIVELFRADARARKELAELLVSEPDIRLAIINAVLKDVATKSDIEQLRTAMENRFEQHRAATKSDIEQLRTEFRRDIEQLRADFRRELEQHRADFRREIDTLAREIDRLYRLVIVSVLGILISIANTILVRLLRHLSATSTILAEQRFCSALPRAARAPLARCKDPIGFPAPAGHGRDRNAFSSA